MYFGMEGRDLAHLSFFFFSSIVSHFFQTPTAYLIAFLISPIRFGEGVAKIADFFIMSQSKHKVDLVLNVQYIKITLKKKSSQYIYYNFLSIFG